EIEVNVDGDFTLEFANPDGAQVLIDDIIWTAHGADEDCMASVPFTEGFENGLPDCWTQEYVSGNADWNVVSENQNGTVTPHSGAQMAEFRVASFAGETTKLISPQLDLTSLDNPQLSIYFANTDWSGDVDELRVYYKTSSDSDWIQIGDDYTDVHESWTPVELALPEPSATYFIAFEAKTNYARGLDIDDVEVAEGEDSPCAAPEGLVVDNITSDSAEVTWLPGMDPDDAQGWQVVFGPEGFDPETDGSPMTIETPFTTLEGLDPDTA